MLAPAAPTVRPLASVDDVAGFMRCMRTGFLEAKPVTEEQAEWAYERWDLSRAWSAFEGKAQCGTARTFRSSVRLPGLGSLPVSCLTQVTVLPTHTRRGHLSMMMKTQLEAAIEAGELASLLVAAEWPIYGRYGYGPATWWAEWRADTDLVEFLDEPVGTVELVDIDELVRLQPEIIARQQAMRPGSIERPDFLVKIRTGADPIPGDDSKPKVRIVHFDDDGVPDGFAVYEPKEKWTGMRPENQLEVHDDAAVDRVARRELWRYLTDVDLVGEVQWDADPADPIRHQLANGRAIRQPGRWDHIWARLLDVPAALTARVLRQRGPRRRRGGRPVPRPWWAVRAGRHPRWCVVRVDPRAGGGDPADRRARRGVARRNVAARSPRRRGVARRRRPPERAALVARNPLVLHRLLRTTNHGTGAGYRRAPEDNQPQFGDGCHGSTRGVDFDAQSLRWSRDGCQPVGQRRRRRGTDEPTAVGGAEDLDADRERRRRRRGRPSGAPAPDTNARAVAGG